MRILIYTFLHYHIYIFTHFHIFTFVFLVLAAACLIFLLVISPAKTSPVVGLNGKILTNSVSTIEKPIIGGIPQGMIIRGENIGNPVLLYVHGGPGGPAYPLCGNDLKKLEKLFTICYWEQRGSGLSYSKNISVASMNLNQLVEDAADCTRYLIKKFDKQKIFILGHSWGSLLGAFTIQKYPELFYAFLGVGQIGDTYLSELESYEFVVNEARIRNNKRALKKLGKLKVPGREAGGRDWYDYFIKQRKYVFKYGGARYGEKRTYSEAIMAVFFCREYTIQDKLNYPAGLRFSQICLDSYMLNDDPDKLVIEQKIPVYIFQGLHDHQTSYTVAKSYFDKLKAPIKKFYTFPYSAHSPHIEEYDAFEKIVKEDILSKG